MQRKKDAAEQAAIPSEGMSTIYPTHSNVTHTDNHDADKDVQMSDGKDLNDSILNPLPLGVLPPIMGETPAGTVAQPRRKKKKKAADKATDLSPSGANEGDQTGEKAEPSKKQKKKIRQQRRG